MQRNDQGLTMVEVLLTLVLVAASAVAMMRFQNYLAFNSSLTRQTGEATSLAMKQIETLRYFQVMNTRTNYNAYNDIASGNQQTLVNGTSYTIASLVTNSTSPAYKNLSVTVSWTDRNGTNRNVRLISNIAAADPLHSAMVI